MADLSTFEIVWIGFFLRIGWEVFTSLVWFLSTAFPRGPFGWFDDEKKP